MDKSSFEDKISPWEIILVYKIIFFNKIKNRILKKW